MAIIDKSQQEHGIHMKKFIFITLVTTLLIACSKNKDSENVANADQPTQEPTKQEMEKRNDTSNYKTNIGHNKTY